MIYKWIKRFHINKIHIDMGIVSSGFWFGFAYDDKYFSFWLWRLVVGIRKE